MKPVAKVIFVVLFFMNFMTANAQLSPIGKTYVGNVWSTCKMMEGGGCTLDNYCSMTFTKESVSIFYYTKANCSPKSREKNYNQKPGEKKIYKWSIQNNSIEIENFTEYGNFVIEETKLIGKKNKDLPLEFVKK